MNKLLSKSLFSKLAKPYPNHVFKQFNSNFIIEKERGNLVGRSRTDEEKYCGQISTPLPYENVMSIAHQETVSNTKDPGMMVGEVQAKMLHQFVKLLKPNRVLEIGGFTGYSAIAMGTALSKNAKILSLELDPHNIKLARNHIKLANLQDKVEFKEGPAGDSLRDLANTDSGTKYDFIFLDANKGGYLEYYELIMKHDMLSQHGLIVADNVLFFGEVHKNSEDYKKQHPNASTTINEAIPERFRKDAVEVNIFNQHVFKDPRVEVVVLPLFDGVSLIRKKD